MAHHTLSITELPNPTTDELDVSSPLEMLRLLRQSDAQLFSGWRHYPGLFDDEILSSIEAVSRHISSLLSSDTGDSGVVVSGAGTSGRLAFFTCREFNQHLSHWKLQRQQQQHTTVSNASGTEEFFHYLIAGGDRALMTAQEQKEDDVNAAVEDLQAFESNKKHIVYIGVTCGMSAPYVAAQLEHAMNANELAIARSQPPKYVCVLIGMTGVDTARAAPIEGWLHRDSSQPKTFKEIAKQLQQKQQQQQQQNSTGVVGGHYYIINPVVGPETVTGSTRMKGGSITKILLEAIFSLAFQFTDSTNNNNNTTTPPNHRGLSTVVNVLRGFESVYRETYLFMKSIARVVEMCGNTLKNNHHIHYVSQHTSLASLALIDASECPPTFGASIEDVRGYVLGGWTTLGNREGSLTELSNDFHITLEQHCNPQPGDTIVLIHLQQQQQQQQHSMDQRIVKLVEESKGKGVNIAIIAITHANQPVDLGQFHDLIERGVATLVTVELSETHLLGDIPAFAEFSVKLVLNALSTGGHVLRGKVFKNKMIDLKVSNNKLFERAIRIISDFGQVDTDTARKCLLKALYNIDSMEGGKEEEVIQQLQQKSVASHIEQAFVSRKVVPRALLLSTGCFSNATATAALQEEPRVSKVIEQVLRSRK